MTTKGIVLAGGNGSRLQPLTGAVNKQLLPVFDKPMVFYPISVLMLAGIREILIISQSEYLPLYQKLLGDGTELGVRFYYAPQDVPAGLAEAFLIGHDFIADDPVALILGDNVLYGEGLPKVLGDIARSSQGATIFSYRVPNPQEFGVVVVDEQGRPIRLDEKPAKPQSNQAVIGLYFYDSSVVERAGSLKPSARGELEITDLNRTYLDDGLLSVVALGRGMAWLDTGTFDALLDAGNFIATLERRQGLKIACLEEIVWRKGWIDDAQLARLGEAKRNSRYGQYLLWLLENG